MAFTNSTTHYGLPQWIGTDKPTYLVDQNNAYATIDTQLYTASTDAASAVATANSASASATTAAENAATALSTANTADGKSDSAITQAELAQTAAGAAQVAAAAAQEAAAGNSIANLAPAYDNTLTYNVGDLVTAEGKLYKCIVTVSTPMDFDINFWDDVTTSEVYARTGVMLSFHTISIDADTSKTNSQYLGDAFANALTQIKNSLDSNHYAIIIGGSYDYLSLTPANMTPVNHESDYNTYPFNYNGLHADGTRMIIGAIHKFSNSNFTYYKSTFENNTVTYADVTDNSASARGLTLDYYIVRRN